MSTPHDMQTNEPEQLLKERLSEGELTELLKRLQAHDAAASEMPTVGAVVEATGADPNLIGRLLEDIRRQTAPQVIQGARAIQVVEVRRTSTAMKVVALIVAAIVAFLVVGLFTVRTVTVESTRAKVEHAAPTSESTAKPTGNVAPEPPRGN